MNARFWHHIPSPRGRSRDEGMQGQMVGPIRRDQVKGQVIIDMERNLMSRQATGSTRCNTPSSMSLLQHFNKIHKDRGVYLRLPLDPGRSKVAQVIAF